MKFIFLACVVAFAVAAPQQKDYRNIQVLKDDRDVRPDGYQFTYETDETVSRNEAGRAFDDSGALAVTGDVEFVHPDGSKTVLTFEADDKGYRPKFTFHPAGR